MTISYNLDVSSSSSWSFLRIIFRWRGSIWKSIFIELIVWTICFIIIACIYRYALPPQHQLKFALLAQYMDGRMEYIPLTFLLGFFVTIVVDRWKNIFANIGFVDTAAFYVSNYIQGDDENILTIKRNIVRYLCLTQVLVLRDISLTVRKRFPNIDAVVSAGFLQEHEKKLMDKVPDDFAKYWMPINWIFSLVVKLRKEGHIAADVLLNAICTETRNFHFNLRTLCNYDWVPVPLAYPQVVFLAVRVYFVICLIGRQYIITEGATNKTIDMFIPFMTQLQLVFYMGWLKVAEALLNPLGEDDDDYECNYIIDRNISIALSMTGLTKEDMPEQIRDTFHSGDRPLYSEETAKLPVHELVGSVARLVVDGEDEKVKMVPREVDEEQLKYMREKRHSTTGLSKRLKEKLQRRSQSVSLRSLEDTRGVGDLDNIPNRPKPWYDNHDFTNHDFSASMPPQRTLETVNEEDNQSDKSK
uniref:Bestrophin homolog n=1 Tax=Panagrellus redivivus TaxID=6233 RepID=A0A7E4UZX2_PANRE